MSLIHLERVEKRYGDLVALRPISLSLDAKRIGLLGPNGAGKSTLMKILLGLLTPDRGVVRVLDVDVVRDPRGARAVIGYMPEGDAVLGHLSALDATRLAAELAGLPRNAAEARAHQVLHYVGLGEARYRLLGTFSTGMKQRARLAQALVAAPKLLLLDEPTSGLDPRGRDEMLDLIAEIPERTGATVLLSTHILPDVERICEDVVVLAGGELLYAGALATLLAQADDLVELRVRGAHGAVREALVAEGYEVSAHRDALEIRLGHHTPEDILRTALGVGAEVRHLAPRRRTLEEAFFDTLDRAAPDDTARAAQG